MDINIMTHDLGQRESIIGTIHFNFILLTNARNEKVKIQTEYTEIRWNKIATQYSWYKSHSDKHHSVNIMTYGVVHNIVN